MSLTESRSDSLLRVFNVVVPAADLEQRLSAKLSEVQPNVKINGFRPGKVPVAHIRKVYGQSLMRDIIDQTVRERTQASITEANARPASEPSLDLKSNLEEVMSGKADLAFDVTLEIMPDFEPVDLKTLNITRPVADVADAQVDEALTELAKSQKTYEDKTGTAEEGDAVVVDFLGKLDGVPFDGGAAENATVVLGAKQFIPGFEEQLAGVSAGDEKVLNVSFPEDYPAANLAGKAATFETKVKQVRAAKETAIDDELAKNLGFEDMSGLKAAVRSRIEADHTQQSRAKAKRALFDQMDKAHEFPLPPRMAEAEFNQIWRQVEADKTAGRLDEEDAAKTDEELRGEYKKIADRRVRLGLVLAEIGRRGQIDVTDQEVSQAVMAQARNFPGRERDIIQMYQKNPNMLAQVRAPLYEEKVVDYVLELVNVKNETVSREQLFAEDEVS
jgi:trigger factor